MQPLFIVSFSLFSFFLLLHLCCKLHVLILLLKESQFNVAVQVPNQDIFGAGEVAWNRGTLINVSCTTSKRRAPQGKILVFQMHTNRALFSKIRTLFLKNQGIFFHFHNRAGDTYPPVPTQLHVCCVILFSLFHL